MRVWSKGMMSRFQRDDVGSIPTIRFNLILNKGDVMMSLNRFFKVATNKKYSGWDFNGDGRFEHDRIKGTDKKNRTKYRRTLENRMMNKEFKNLPL